MVTIERILAEGQRICNDESIISLRIDYADHYRRTDPKINAYNFLSFEM